MNRLQESSTRRFLALSFCALLLATGASAHEPEGALKPGEAFVIVRVIGDVRGASFQRFQGAESFTAERNTFGKLMRVKAGRYYLKSVTPVHLGITLPPYPEPTEPSRTVAVREGRINYIGDWTFVEDKTASDIRYDTRLKFELDLVKSIVMKHDLPKYELMVSRLGELPTKTALP